MGAEHTAQQTRWTLCNYDVLLSHHAAGWAVQLSPTLLLHGIVLLVMKTVLAKV